MADEYVPDYVDKKALVNRLVPKLFYVTSTIYYRDTNAQLYYVYQPRIDVLLSIYMPVYEFVFGQMIISIGFDSCRLCRAMGGAEKVEIEWGNHSLSNRVEEAVQAIMNFVKREGPSGWDDPWS